MLVIREQSPKCINTQHGEKATDQYGDDCDNCGRSVLALLNDYTASHPEHGKDDDRRIQT